ncbi:MAG: hypothetical protein IT302_06340 [Dehalococcoidia bacterium]|nr:hypothetical protein [Dehalococcoidia bacterium]
MTIRTYPPETRPLARATAVAPSRPPFWLLVASVAVRGAFAATVAGMPSGRHARRHPSTAWTETERPH